MKFILPIVLTVGLAFAVFAPLEWCNRVLDSRAVELVMYGLSGLVVLLLLGTAWAWAIWT